MSCRTAFVVSALLIVSSATPGAAETPAVDTITFDDVNAVGRWGELYTGAKVFGEDCSGGWECHSGLCVQTPNGQACSRHCDLGCPDGWECGVCIDSCPFSPLADVCLVPCAPQCSGKSCGDDGCGGSCGMCEPGTKCGASGTCEQCAADCTERTCGPDGCGGSCGDCDDGFMCTPDGLCAAGATADSDEPAAGSNGGCSAAPAGAANLLATLFLAIILLALRRRIA